MEYWREELFVNYQFFLTAEVGNRYHKKRKGEKKREAGERERVFVNSIHR
jgi:hypothetical protein